MSPIPEEFARTIVQLRGPGAAGWLRTLPRVLDEYARRWSLSLGEPFAALSFNYVTRALRADGTPVALKVGFPDDTEFRTEAEMLRHCDGRGMVRLLEADLDGSVMLLERIEPGVPLTAVEDDEQAISAAIGVMRQFWRPAPALPHLPPRSRAGHSGWSGTKSATAAVAPSLPGSSRGSRHSTAIWAPPLRRRCCSTATCPRTTSSPPRASPGWPSIRRGWWGEPAYEGGSLLRNPQDQLLALPDPKPLLARRVAQLADALQGQPTRDSGSEQSSWVAGHGTAIDSTARWS